MEEEHHELAVSSRLCVKNLPAYVDEVRLREHFGERGEVTDAKVIRAGCVPAPRCAALLLLLWQRTALLLMQR